MRRFGDDADDRSAEPRTPRGSAEGGARGGFDRNARGRSDGGDRAGFGRNVGDRGDRAGFDRNAGDRGDRGDRAGFDRESRAGAGRGERSSDRGGQRTWQGRPARPSSGSRGAAPRPDRGPRTDRPVDPHVPSDVEYNQLDREVRGRLRTLSKEQAERVGKHLVMVARLIDTDPELAYEHAQAAVRRAGRVDVAHEAAGLAAYRSGRYAEALRELRTVRRLNGSPEHLPVIADAERGLGRPERALAVGNDPDVAQLSGESQVELAMVLSGARLDLGEPEAAVAVLDTAVVRGASGVLAARVAQARAAALTALGRADDAGRELSRFSQEELDIAAGDVEEDDDVLVYDLLDEEDELPEGEDLDGSAEYEPSEDAEPEDGSAPGEAGEPGDDEDDAAEDRS